MTLHALAAEAAAHWGGTIVRLISTRENAVFEIRLPGRRAALRLHRPGYQTDGAIESELWWCTALADADLPVPAALPSDKGFLVTLTGGHKASAVTWVDGRPLGQMGQPLDLTPARAEQIHHRLGHLMAGIHSTTDRLDLPGNFSRPRWDIPGLVGDAPFWGRFWDHPLALPHERGLLLDVRDSLHSTLTAHQDGGGSFGPIHADLLPENVFVLDELVSLIDFDDSGFGFRLYDLGTALLHCLNTPQYPDLRAALMAGYGTSDEKMVDAFALARACASVGLTISRFAPDHPIHRSHIARACEMARNALR